MKAKVLHVGERMSKKGAKYHKILVQFENGVVGFAYDFDRKGVVGGTVEFTVDTDYQNFVRLVIK